MQQFGKKQLGLIITLFMIGSTPLFQLGNEAKQDAWLAMSLAAAAGLLLTAVYLTLHKRAPQAGLADLYKMHLGRWLGGGLALVYALWFAYESMRNVRDVGELATLALLHSTPKWVIMLLFLLAAAYTAMKGVEVFVRVIQILFPIVVRSYIVIIILLFVGGLVRPGALLPVLGDGMAPVWKAAFPDLVSFPFGQMVVFLVFWGLVRDSKSIGGVTFTAQIGVSLFLIFMNTLILSVIGPSLAGLTAFPLLHAVQLISVADFLERLDIIVTLLLLIGLYVKITMLYIASVLTASAATGTSYRSWVLPTGVVIYISSFLEPNYTYHLWLGLDLSLKVVPAFQIILPLILLVIGVRKRYKGAAKAGGSQA